MPHARRQHYSDFFAHLQSAQDILAESLGICLVLVDSNAREVTLPSALPVVCNEHKDCARVHAQYINQLSSEQGEIIRCPNGRHVIVLKTSIETDEENLYLLAGRTTSRAQAESCLDLVNAIYTLPFGTPDMERRNGAGGSSNGSGSSSVSALSPQESKVLACVAAGLPNKEIAEQLCISRSTVKAHIASILKKLNLSNRTEAGVYALKNGFTQDADRV